jgi:hypothetical protein
MSMKRTLIRYKTKPDRAHENQRLAVTSIPELEAFRLFQSGHKERCIESPQSGVATIVGNYRMLREP